jgi:acetyl esterase/lipase
MVLRPEVARVQNCLIVRSAGAMKHRSVLVRLGWRIVSATILMASISSHLSAEELEPQHRNIIYASVGERALRLDLYLPADKGDAAPLLIVWVHGGAWRAGSKDDMPLAELVRRGYAIASVAYRLSPEARFPAQVHDIKAAIRFLKASATKYGYSANNLTLAGASAGGHLALLAAVTHGNEQLEGMLGEHRTESSKVDACIVYYGMSNLTTILAQSTPHGLKVRVPALQLLLGGQPDEVPDLALLASPVHHIDDGDPPVLLLHGDQDPQAPINQAHEVVGKYVSVKQPAKFVVLYGSKHGGSEFFDAKRSDLVDQFLDEALKTAPTSP